MNLTTVMIDFSPAPASHSNERGRSFCGTQPRLLLIHDWPHMDVSQIMANNAVQNWMRKESY